MQKIDDLIIKCNTAIRDLISGNYVSWCNLMAQIVRDLAELKTVLEAREGEDK